MELPTAMPFAWGLHPALMEALAGHQIHAHAGLAGLVHVVQQM